MSKNHPPVKLDENTEFVVIDVATTGFRPDVDAPVEVAAVRLTAKGVKEHKVWRIDPEVHIPPAASAHHEIRDKHVRGCPKLADVQKEIESFVGGSPIVMHNLSKGEPLDKAMLPFLSESTWICSARLSKHLWPQLTEKNGFPLANYDVWTLTYWLQGPKEAPVETKGAQVYEPLANALATAHVFRQGYGEYLEQFKSSQHDLFAGEDKNVLHATDLQAYTEAPVQVVLMPHGPFKNCLMTDLEEDYFKTLLPLLRMEDVDKDFAYTLEKEADRRIKSRYNYSGGLKRSI
jgi:Exonuclease